MLHLSSLLKWAASALLFGLLKDYIAELIIVTPVSNLGFVCDPVLALFLDKEANVRLLIYNIWAK